MYQVKRASRSEFVPIRNLNYHVRLWGEPQTRRAAAGAGARLDGRGRVATSSWWMPSRRLCAGPPHHRARLARLRPDRRCRGRPTTTGFPTTWPTSTSCSTITRPDQPVDLVGHSMGGNVVMLYAGVRPARIRRLVNLEGFGMPATQAVQAPGRYAKWMDELKSLHRGELALKTYDDVDGVARRLMKTNPRLGQDKADWLASHWAQPERRPTGPSGRSWATPAHKIINAQLYRVDEVLAIYSASPRPRWPSRPPTTAWAGGGRANTRWPSTTSASSPCRTAGVRWSRRRPHAAPRPARATGRSDGKLPRVRKWRVAACRPLKTAGNSHHGSRTSQPDRRPTHGPERQDRSFTGVSLTSMPNPKD